MEPTAASAQLLLGFVAQEWFYLDEAAWPDTGGQKALSAQFMTGQVLVKQRP
jgi:hypothetical protein